MHDCLRQTYPSLKTLGQRLNSLLANRIKLYLIQHMLHALTNFFSSKASNLSDEVEKLQGSHVAIGGSSLRQIAHERLGLDWVLADIETVNTYRAMASRKETSD